MHLSSMIQVLPSGMLPSPVGSRPSLIRRTLGGQGLLRGKVKVAQLCPTLFNSMDYPWNSPDQNTGVGSLSLLQGISPGIEPRSPALEANSLPAEPQGKPKNTGVGSLFLLQRIFLSQELNWGLLHCRQILYQLNYQEACSGGIVAN